MITPQEISEKGFVKAVFGGYDMESVDDFLETVSADYSALYKENAILKGKLKVLVEKVEEYRSTEDAMRMALLTAQRMGEEITVEANRTKEEMLQTTENEIKTRLSDTAKRIADEELRLSVATKETAKFIELSQAIMRKHAEFLEKLETVRRAAKAKVKTEQDAQDAAVKAPRQAKQAPPVKSAPTQKPTPPVAPAPPVAPSPPVSPAPPINPATIDATQEVHIDSIAEQIGSVVEQFTESAAPQAPKIAPAPEAPPAPMVAEPPPSLFEDDDGSVKLFSSDVEEEITPRPKFDFDDLKFGANFDTDD